MPDYTFITYYKFNDSGNTNKEMLRVKLFSAIAAADLCPQVYTLSPQAPLLETLPDDDPY